MIVVCVCVFCVLFDIHYRLYIYMQISIYAHHSLYIHIYTCICLICVYIYIHMCVCVVRLGSNICGSDLLIPGRRRHGLRRDLPGFDGPLRLSRRMGRTSWGSSQVCIYPYIQYTSFLTIRIWDIVGYIYILYI